MGEIYAGNNIQIDGNINIGHGPTGVKARCYFNINTAYLTKAGTLKDNSSQHPLAIELSEDLSRTFDTLIAEINAQGEKLEITAIKRDATSIYLESSMPGSFANGIVFTYTGCLSAYSDGRALTITQGSNVKGLDEGAASDWELHQNGYPVASRQSNNVYEGVQVFNNAVALNGPVSVKEYNIAIGRVNLNTSLLDYYHKLARYNEMTFLNSMSLLDLWKWVYNIRTALPRDLAEPTVLHNVTAVGYQMNVNGNGGAAGNPYLEYLPDAWLFDNLTSCAGGWAVGPFSGMSSLKELPANMTLSKFVSSNYGYITAYGGLFAMCTSLKKLPDGMTFPLLKAGVHMFSNCTSLEYLPEGTTFDKLTLAGWDGDTMDGSGAHYGMFFNCVNLHSLPSSLNLASLTQAGAMFMNCRLDEESVLRVLTTIPSYTEGSHLLGVGYNTNWAYSEEVASLLETSTPVKAAVYNVKGWKISVQS